MSTFLIDTGCQYILAATYPWQYSHPSDQHGESQGLLRSLEVPRELLKLFGLKDPPHARSSLLQCLLPDKTPVSAERLDSQPQCVELRLTSLQTNKDNIEAQARGVGQVGA